MWNPGLIPQPRLLDTLTRTTLSQTLTHCVFYGSWTFQPATSSENQEASEGRAGRGRHLTSPSGQVPGTSPPEAYQEES